MAAEQLDLPPVRTPVRKARSRTPSRAKAIEVSRPPPLESTAAATADAPATPVIDPPPTRASSSNLLAQAAANAAEPSVISDDERQNEDQDGQPDIGQMVPQTPPELEQPFKRPRTETGGAEFDSRVSENHVCHLCEQRAGD